MLWLQQQQSCPTCRQDIPVEAPAPAPQPQAPAPVEQPQPGAGEGRGEGQPEEQPEERRTLRVAFTCDACGARSLLCFASVFTTLVIIASPLAKNALAALHTTSRQAKTSVQPHQVVAKGPTS